MWTDAVDDAACDLLDEFPRHEGVIGGEVQEGVVRDLVHDGLDLRGS